MSHRKARLIAASRCRKGLSLLNRGPSTGKDTEMTKAETRSAEIAARALEGHRRWRGKMQTIPKCPVRGVEDFALWYTPGVAAAARVVAEDPAQASKLCGIIIPHEAETVNPLLGRSPSAQCVSLADSGSTDARESAESNSKRAATCRVKHAMRCARRSRLVLIGWRDPEPFKTIFASDSSVQNSLTVRRALSKAACG